MWVASFITATVAIVSVFLLLYAISRRGMFRLLLAAFFCALPMCWIMYHLIRMPQDHWLAAMFPRDNVLFWIRTQQPEGLVFGN